VTRFFCIAVSCAVFVPVAWSVMNQAALIVA
jgi:hypothetical protein